MFYNVETESGGYTKLILGFEVSKPSWMDQYQRPRLREKVAELRGLVEPKERPSEDKAAWNARYGQHSTAVDRAVKELGCNLAHICVVTWRDGNGYRSHHFYVEFVFEGTDEYRAFDNLDFGKMQSIARDPKILERLRRFCDLLGLEYKEPNWFLAHDR